jgi:hypothetical protein
VCLSGLCCGEAVTQRPVDARAPAGTIVGEPPRG